MKSKSTNELFSAYENIGIGIVNPRAARFSSCPLCKVRVSSMQEHCDRMPDEEHTALGVHEA